jgi:hypothetical protein
MQLNDYTMGHSSDGFCTPNEVPFYMLDPGLLATVSLTSAYVLAASPTM